MTTPKQTAKGNWGCCATSAEWAEYSDGTLDQARRLEFEEHLESCPPCREVASLLAGVEWGRVDAIREPLTRFSKQPHEFLIGCTSEGDRPLKVELAEWKRPARAEKRSEAGLIFHLPGGAKVALGAFRLGQVQHIFAYGVELPSDLEVSAQSADQKHMAALRGSSRQWNYVAALPLGRIVFGFKAPCSRGAQTPTQTQPVDIFEAFVSLRVAGPPATMLPSLPSKVMPRPEPNTLTAQG